MLLITHVILAVLGIAYTALTVVLPTEVKIKISGLFVGLTVLSGTVLVISAKSALLKACFTGLAYLAVNILGIHIASRRLQTEKVRNN